MIDSKENLILIDGICRTQEIDDCSHDEKSGKYEIVFKNSSKRYLYNRNKVLWLKNPTALVPDNYRISYNNCQCSNVVSLLEFTCGFNKFYQIEYASGTIVAYSEKDIEIVESCLKEPESRNILDYLKEVAKANPLETDKGDKILAIQYENIDFIDKSAAIAPYLCPEKYTVAHRSCKKLTFPFGCNISQMNAVQQAFENQISVVQGPPGTGKTQTILNIIANILISGKTVIVVSNNNSATENVLEKLQKYDLGFMVASLGSSSNKKQFLSDNKGKRKYPETLYGWKDEETEKPESREDLNQCVTSIKDIFANQERLAICRQTLADTKLEYKHFVERFGEPAIDIDSNVSSDIVLRLLNEQQERAYTNSHSWLAKIRWFIKRFTYKHFYKINKGLVDGSGSAAIRRTQSLFYTQRIKELTNEIAELESKLESADAQSLMKDISCRSMRLLKNALHKKYASIKEPYEVKEDSLAEKERFLDEFPIVLSTTFSACSSLHNAFYDYIIMDEASQVSVETGALALSCARNAVIVGDTLQLPNVVTKEQKCNLDSIFSNYGINKGYDSGSKSFLQSVIDVIPSVPQTLLREHYRCAPRIINFCNQKFYGGKLVIMTKEDESDSSMYAIETVSGSHSRGHVNQREIDVIRKEVLPKLNYENDEIGIIAPYKDQVEAIQQSFEDIDVATIHKFQGREKDAIVLSVVDSTVKEFSDDPNKLNVAVSRAKKKFCIVVSDEIRKCGGNISDLLGYIEYNNGTVSKSNVHSVFDLLYKQNAAARAEFLKGKKRISEYDSENIMYTLLMDILSNNSNINHLDVVPNYPMNLLIRDYSCLTDTQYCYASNDATHIDFLVYNRVSKKPVLAIEVDGWAFHRKGSAQSERDKMKDEILSLYDIELLRLSTTGSEEKDIIEDKLRTLLANK